MIKVFVVDDHQVILDGLRRMLDNNSEIEVIGQAMNGPDCLEEFQSSPADVAIVDINLPVADQLVLGENISAAGYATAALAICAAILKLRRHEH